MLEILKTREDLQRLVDQELTLVPTMGSLHLGHLSLLQQARAFGGRVIISIFVNPLQFGEGEDFDAYPRDLDTDIKKIADFADYLWVPSQKDIFPAVPEQIEANTELTDKLCGISRPGHFDGVCTVVKALFDAVKPQRAIFGEKDYQQLMIIKDMVERYQIPVEIIAAQIIREPSGLALSSRNQYLSEKHKELAQNIYKQISAVSARELDFEQAKENLINFGFELEYLESHWGRLFVAVRLGNTRLIDNIAIDF